MNIIFQVNGGIGKVVASTAVCKAIKSKYPDSKLIVLSGYPEVFLGNPSVDRAYGFTQVTYFYEQYVENQEIIVFGHDPYFDTKHIRNEEHLIETWCRMYDLPMVQKHGELFLTKVEIDQYTKKYTSSGPILLMQTNGGPQADSKYSWARDIPENIVKDVIKAYKDKYHIVHIKREDQTAYDFTTPVQDNFRAILVLVMLSEKRLLMDSFVEHAAAALNKPSVVLWIANSPKVFGYDMHTNILANKETRKPELKNSVLSKYNIGGDMLEFPYNDDSEIFDSYKIVKALK